MFWFIKRYVAGLFDRDTADAFLMWWIRNLFFLRYFLPDCCRVRCFVAGLRIGLWVHRCWGFFWVCLLDYYLRTDHNWPDTERRMLLNPFCPIGLCLFYRDLIFGFAGDISWLPERTLTLYRARQVRCGFTPVI